MYVQGFNNAKQAHIEPVILCYLEECMFFPFLNLNLPRNIPG